MTEVKTANLQFLLNPLVAHDILLLGFYFFFACDMIVEFVFVFYFSVTLH